MAPPEIMLAVSHPTEEPVALRRNCVPVPFLRGKLDRLSLQVKENIESDIWFKRLFAEIAHILE
jgi:hypothetical protein